MEGHFLKRLVGVRASIIWILTQFQTKICTELPLSCFRADIEIDTQQYIEKELKTRSDGKSSNFSFQWTKILYQNKDKHCKSFFNFLIPNCWPAEGTHRTQFQTNKVQNPYPLASHTTHISYCVENSVTVRIWSQPCQGLDLFASFPCFIGSKKHKERLEEIESMTSTPSFVLKQRAT